jgi:DNA-binding response OmpR family regulator
MGASNKDREGSVPRTFGVRFESRDDFVVEYGDFLRHGIVRLPLAEPLRERTPVRIRLTLPDDTQLFVTGAVQRSSTDDTRIKLDRLEPEQRAAIERCVRSMADSLGSSADGTPDPDDEPITILLVDDSVSQRIEVGDALRERGCRVRVAENGLLALAQALKRTPDVILTDVEMPQMDGWTLLRSVRQRKRLAAVPVVFLTRLSDELSRLRGYRLGADDFLPKTMPPEEVLARLHGVIARRRQMPSTADSHGLHGDLEHVSLGSLFSFLETERRTGALNLRRGADTTTLFVRSGALVGVENLGRFHHPHDRVFEVLSWRVGAFDFVPGGSDDEPAATSEEASLSYLLMEHARRQDEAERENE